jgi:hypothetical protein
MREFIAQAADTLIILGQSTKKATTETKSLLP